MAAGVGGKESFVAGQGSQGLFLIFGGGQIVAALRRHFAEQDMCDRIANVRIDVFGVRSHFEEFI